MIGPRLLAPLLSMLLAVPFPRFDGVDDATKSLKDAIVVDDVPAVARAIESLVGTGEPRALTVLNEYVADSLVRLGRAQKEADKCESELERRKRTIERKRSIAKDEQQRAQVDHDDKELKEWITKTLEPARKTLESQRAERDALTKGSGDLIAKLAPERRRAEIDRLRKVVAGDSAWQDRAGAMENYARLGDKDSVPTIVKVAKDAVAQRRKLAPELAEKEASYEKVRVILAREIQQLGGRSTVATNTQLNRALKEVTELQERIEAQRRLMDSAFRLLPVAVASLPEEARAKAAAEVLALAKGNDAALKLGAIESLGGIPDPAALALLRSLAAGAGDPAPRVAALDALAHQRDAGALDAILDKCLKDPEWTIRAAAIQALASIRAARAVPALIAALENEVGRLRDDANETLQAVTGLQFPNAAGWKGWWEKSQADFKPVEATASAPAPGKRLAGGGDTVAFAGIATSSKNVAFVVDVSGSMKFGLHAEEPPPEGEPTRFAMLKRELLNALERVPDGGKFALLTFSTLVTKWTPKVEVMGAAMRKKVTEYVNTEMQAEGSTNIYGALKEVFDLAGMGASDKYYRPAIDTIYFLTDGTPSPDTEVTDPERILEYVRERNRLGKITIHVVCLGEADAAFLRALAKQNHGDFVQP